jgi:hypothetical protein
VERPRVVVRLADGRSEMLPEAEEEVEVAEGSESEREKPSNRAN